MYWHHVSELADQVDLGTMESERENFYDLADGVVFEFLEEDYDRVQLVLDNSDSVLDTSLTDYRREHEGLYLAAYAMKNDVAAELEARLDD